MVMVVIEQVGVPLVVDHREQVGIPLYLDHREQVGLLRLDQRRLVGMTLQIDQ